MGKATIIENLENAKYKINLIFNKTELQSKVDALNIKIAALQIAIDAQPEGIVKESLKLQMLSLQKTLAKYTEFLDAPDPEYTVYCADFSDGLTGDVGTIELVGDPDKAVQIRPGYGGTAVYNEERDGQMVYTTGLTPACDFYNYTMLHGWQKWMPKYRYAVITSITVDICNITLEACEDRGFDLNYKSSFSAVPIEYMDVNGEPFKVGDEVLVQLDDWDTPKVVGFKVPKRATPLVMLKVEFAGKIDYVSIWDAALNITSETIPLDGGGFAVFPCQESLLSNWIAATKDLSNDLWTTTEKGFDGTWEDYTCEPDMDSACVKETFRENECSGLDGELLEDYINYRRSKTTTNYGMRYDDYIQWIPNEIYAYMPDVSENFNFNSTEITAINGSGYTGSMIIYLYHLYYKYYIWSYTVSWFNYFNSHKYTIKTPIGEFEQLETDSFIWDPETPAGDPEIKSDIHIDPLYADLVGKYSRLLFAQIYWMQYKYSGDSETDRTISIIAQAKPVADATVVSPRNGLGRDTLFEAAIEDLISTWYTGNSYGVRDIVDCTLSMQLVV